MAESFGEIEKGKSQFVITSGFFVDESLSARKRVGSVGNANRTALRFIQLEVWS